MFDYTWILVAISLAGNIFVIQKNVLGQWLWAIANVGWITHWVVAGQIPSAFLFSVYLVLCVWGIVTWTREAKAAAAAA